MSQQAGLKGTSAGEIQKYSQLWPRFSSCRTLVGSNMAAGQEVEGPILAAVGRLKLVPQTKLPLVLQLQPDDGLTQGTSVLADHTEGGAWGRNQG